jgi:hypothetical protein
MHSSTFWLNNFSHFYLKTEQNESSQQQSKISARIRVFKPARWLAQFKTGVPGFDRVARVNSIFFKNQNDVVLVKKKKQVTTGSCRVNRITRSLWVLTFSIFS